MKRKQIHHAGIKIVSVLSSVLCGLLTPKVRQGECVRPLQCTSSHLSPFLRPLSLYVGIPQSVMHGQCDARPAVTFPAAEYCAHFG